MIKKLESAGLGFRMKASETQEMLGIISNYLIVTSSCYIPYSCNSFWGYSSSSSGVSSS